MSGSGSGIATAPIRRVRSGIRWDRTRAVDLNDKMISDLKDIVRKIIDKSGHGRYILVVEKDSFSFDLKLSVPYDLQDEVKPAYESIKSRMNDEYKASAKRIETALSEEEKIFVGSRGIISSPEGLRVDYRRSVQNNRARIKHVLEAMRRIDARLNLRQFLGLSLSFIQDLAYGVPPAVEGGKLILGFWVPPKVLANNFGDCDSKGVTFAALWMNFKRYPLLLIRVPDHMFIGLAIPSLESEGVVINGLRYTLCEVSATEKVPPGLVSYYSRTWLESGRYQYDLVTR